MRKAVDILFPLNQTLFKLIFRRLELFDIALFWNDV